MRRAGIVCCQHIYFTCNEWAEKKSLMASDADSRMRSVWIQLYTVVIFRKAAGEEWVGQNRLGRGTAGQRGGVKSPPFRGQLQFYIKKMRLLLLRWTINAATLTHLLHLHQTIRCSWGRYWRDSPGIWRSPPCKSPGCPTHSSHCFQSEQKVGCQTN